ncbi:L-2-amino-thiazoline-4-carboxylic acid hydrolase [candidate division KSB1 bacterium]
MAVDINTIGMLARREIEARIAGPIIDAFIKEFGEERTLKIVKDVITGLAKESGQQLRESVGGNSLRHFMKGMELWKKDDAYEAEILEQSETKLSTNTTRCRYAEMYKELGMEKLGVILSCGRDFALMEGFNPSIKLTRTQTIMEGAPYCDFRYCMEKK